MTAPTDLTRCDNCGRFGWHTTARCPDPATSAEMDRIELDDMLRRIRNIVDAYPQGSWRLDEAKAVLAALSGMVRVRQGDGALCVTVTVASQSGGPDIEVSTRLENPAVELDRHAANGTVWAEQP
jgi:hypothetical protein